MGMSLNNEQLKKFVASLDPELQKIFTAADNYCLAMGDYDTLSHEFQLAANIVEIFWKRAANSAMFDE